MLLTGPMVPRRSVARIRSMARMLWKSCMRSRIPTLATARCGPQVARASSPCSNTAKMAVLPIRSNTAKMAVLPRRSNTAKMAVPPRLSRRCATPDFVICDAADVHYRHDRLAAEQNAVGPDALGMIIAVAAVIAMTEIGKGSNRPFKVDRQHGRQHVYGPVGERPPPAASASAGQRA